MQKGTLARSVLFYGNLLRGVKIVHYVPCIPRRTYCSALRKIPPLAVCEPRHTTFLPLLLLCCGEVRIHGRSPKNDKSASNEVRRGRKYGNFAKGEYSLACRLRASSTRSARRMRTHIQNALRFEWVLARSASPKQKDTRKECLKLDYGVREFRKKRIFARSAPGERAHRSSSGECEPIFKTPCVLSGFVRGAHHQNKRTLARSVTSYHGNFACGR